MPSSDRFEPREHRSRARDGTGDRARPPASGRSPRSTSRPVLRSERALGRAVGRGADPPLRVRAKAICPGASKDDRANAAAQPAAAAAIHPAPPAVRQRLAGSRASPTSPSACRILARARSRQVARPLNSRLDLIEETLARPWPGRQALRRGGAAADRGQRDGAGRARGADPRPSRPDRCDRRAGARHRAPTRGKPVISAWPRWRRCCRTTWRSGGGARSARPPPAHAGG